MVARVNYTSSRKIARLATASVKLTTNLLSAARIPNTALTSYLGLPPPPLRPESRTTERCMMHALAFADAVIPATKFLIAAGYKTTDTDNE